MYFLIKIFNKELFNSLVVQKKSIKKVSSWLNYLVPPHRKKILLKT
jgi:hypothetical protein